jgi:glutamine amidotransferase
MIGIIDYGVGNLFSLKSSLAFLGCEVIVTGDGEELKGCEKIILPGVGAFEDAVEKLKRTGLVSLILEELDKGKPMLGICLGMQLLFDKSFEYGEHKGLGLIPGTVVPIPKDQKNTDNGDILKIPHIGWNSLKIIKDDPIFHNLPKENYVYFVHSFYASGCQNNLLALSDYGVDIPAVVRKGSLYGTQFHPEKSGLTGLNILKAFIELSKEDLG